MSRPVDLAAPLGERGGRRRRPAARPSRGGSLHASAETKGPRSPPGQVERPGAARRDRAASGYHLGGMDVARTSRRPPLAPLLAVAIAGLLGAGFVAGCGEPPQPRSPSPSSSSIPTSSPATPGDGGPSSPTLSPSVPPSLPSQSETTIGRIWDALPPSFPLPSGAEPTEVREPEEPASGVFAVPGSALEVATSLRDALEAKGFVTAAANGPFEDGSYVIDSAAGAGCRIRSTVRPMGDLTVLLVRYGAACPFE